MSEQEKVRPRSPDNVLTLARQDTIAAHQIFESVGKKNPAWEAEHGSMIAQSYIDVGMPALARQFLPQLDKAMDEWDHTGYKVEPLARKVYLQIGLGDIDGAFETADKISENSEPGENYYVMHVYKNIANYTQDQETAKKALTKAEEIVDNSHWDYHAQLSDLKQLAKISHIKGLPTDRLLDKAKTILEKGYGTESYWHAYLAEAYASVGRFSDALAIIPQIKGDSKSNITDRSHQLATMREIAYQQIAAGKIDDAMQTAELTNDSFSQASIMVESARASVKIKGRGDYEFENVIKAVRNYEEATTLTDYDQSHGYCEAVVSFLYTTLAEIQIELGKDPSQFLQKAMETTTKIPPYTEDLIVSLLEIAKVQKKAGIDIEPILNQTLSIADTIQEQDPDNQFSYISQMLEYEDIGQIAFELGYDGVMEQIFERYDKYGAIFGEDYTQDKIKMLTVRAKARMDRARQTNNSTS